MKNSIRTELKQYILEGMQDLNQDNLTSKPGRLDANELHQELFNVDYYIIGYYKAEQWLKQHQVSTFDAISQVQEWELDNFGQAKNYDNAESLVNMLVYIYGEQLINECFQELELF